jgi:hypothetical protein
MKIAFTTSQTAGELLTYKPSNPQNTNKYDECDVYKLTCMDCQRAYVGQTGRSFGIRFKEHKLVYKTKNQKSNYAKHLLYYGHAWYPMEDSMTILQTANKDGC